MRTELSPRHLHSARPLDQANRKEATLMKLLIVLTVFCSGANLTACRSGSDQNASSTTSQPAPPTDAPTMKIWISKTGSVEVNGRQVEVESVGAMLTEHAQRKGEVLYGRDAAEEDPHPNAMRVLQMVMASGLPIRMSKKRDYSDAVRLDGVIR
jgi:biopolymer transport protein ExbD